MAVKISPRFDNDYLANDPDGTRRINVFEDRINGWMLNIAKDMSKQMRETFEYDTMNHAGYAIISVVFSYFEMIQQFIEGESSDGETDTFFEKGFRKVYPRTKLTSIEIKQIWKRV